LLELIDLALGKKLGIGTSKMGLEGPSEVVPVLIRL